MSPEIIKNKDTGNQTSQGPITGITDAIIAKNVNVSELGTPKINKPSPVINPWITPVTTWPYNTACVTSFDLFKNSFWDRIS